MLIPRRAEAGQKDHHAVAVNLDVPTGNLEEDRPHPCVPLEYVAGSCGVAARECSRARKMTGKSKSFKIRTGRHRRWRWRIDLSPRRSNALTRIMSRRPCPEVDPLGDNHELRHPQFGFRLRSPDSAPAYRRRRGSLAAARVAGYSIPASSLALVVDDPTCPRTSPGFTGSFTRFPQRATDCLRVFHRSCGHRPEPVVSGPQFLEDGRLSRPGAPRGHGIHRYFFKLHALDQGLRASRKGSTRWAYSRRSTRTSSRYRS